MRWQSPLRSSTESLVTHCKNVHTIVKSSRSLDLFFAEVRHRQIVLFVCVHTSFVNCTKIVTDVGGSRYLRASLVLDIPHVKGGEVKVF